MSAPARWVAGVDGCRSGWAVVLRELNRSEAPRLALAARFQDVLEAPEDPQIIAVDMPIGLPDRTGPGGRAAEQAARPHLGPRQSSVFSVPARPAVMCEDYAQACRVALAHTDPPRKVSIQCFHIFPKIREIDALMTPELEARVYEVHPELSFWRVNGEQAMALPKKLKGGAHGPGLAERRTLLEAHGFEPAFFDKKRPTGVGADDLIDASVNALIAERIATGEAQSFPPDPPRDPKGLRIAIWA